MQIISRVVAKNQQRGKSLSPNSYARWLHKSLHQLFPTVPDIISNHLHEDLRRGSICYLDLFTMKETHPERLNLIFGSHH